MTYSMGYKNWKTNDLQTYTLVCLSRCMGNYQACRQFLMFTSQLKVIWQFRITAIQTVIPPASLSQS